MNLYEIESLPTVKFAHTFSANSYSNAFEVKNDCMEITFIAEGKLDIIIHGQTFTAKKGDVVCLNYDTEIRVFAANYHRHSTVYAQISKKAVDSIDGLYLPLITPSALNTKNAQGIIDKLACNRLSFKDSPTKGAILFLNLLYEIDKCNRNIKKVGVPGEQLYAKRVKEYIHENIHLPITQREIAKHLSVSPEYLCSVFRKSEGVTIIRYCNTEKLQAIKSLVDNERMRLHEAAALYGYSDPNYVSRLFKKYFGYCITESPDNATLD